MCIRKINKDVLFGMVEKMSEKMINIWYKKLQRNKGLRQSKHFNKIYIKRVCRKGEVALSRFFSKLQEGWEAKGKRGPGSMEVCLLKRELLVIIKLYNPEKRRGKVHPETC